MNTPLVPFQAGSPIMIAGPTGSGKTFWTNKFLINQMFSEPVSSVLYCYGVYQTYYDKMEIPNLELHEGLPSLDKVQSLNDGKFHVIVLDDLMEYIVKSVETQNLFTKYCHHYNITAIFLTQNVFAQGPCSRTISINTHILVLFANKRDESQAMNLGKQLYPSNSKVFMEAYEDATSTVHGYLVIDCDPTSPRDLKLRTHIFPGEQTVMSNWEKYLKDIYLDPSHPASFGSPDRLYKIVKKEGKHKISHSQIKKWIQKQESYSLNKGLKRKFQRGRVVVEGIDDQFDIDLASLIYYADDNDGYKYLLVVIDIFSHYGWVEPLKDKTANEIVLQEGRIPKRLRSDAAKDFTSEKFQKYVKSKNITHFVTHTEKQANYVECFIKTLKSKIFKYMVEKNSPRYIDVLPKIVKSYNRTWHSGISNEPINVNKTNEKQLWWQMYWPKEPYDPNRKKHEIKYAFKIDDRVRTTFLRRTFQHEYNTRWTGEIF